MTIEASLKAAKRSCRGTPPLGCALLKFDIFGYHLAALGEFRKNRIQHGGVMSAILVAKCSHTTWKAGGLITWFLASLTCLDAVRVTTLLCCSQDKHPVRQPMLTSSSCNQ